jgi:UDP-glucose 4-epimerase
LADPPARIAITGSAGFLGEATLECLTRLPSTEVVAAIDLKPTQGLPGETRRFISAVRDLREPIDDLLADLHIDAVVHLAFVMRPPRNESRAREVNVDATARLLQSCVAGGVKQFIYLSSTTVYGAHPTYERPYFEYEPVNPVRGFSYSEHKVEAENLVLRTMDENLDFAACVLRGCVVMAPGADNFIADSLGMRFLPAPIGANPEMQFLHIDDYTSAVETALGRHARGIYNIAGSGTIRWREMVKAAGGTVIPAPAPLLGALTGLTWQLGLQHRSPACGLNFIRYPWLASTEKIEKEMKWKPRYSSREALESWTSERRGDSG